MKIETVAVGEFTKRIYLALKAHPYSLGLVIRADTPAQCSVVQAAIDEALGAVIIDAYRAGVEATGNQFHLVQGMHE
jgi:hypothetical protein